MATYGVRNGVSNGRYRGPEFGPDKLARLKEAVGSSRRGLEVYRKNRLYALRQYVGGHYNERGAPGIVPVNLIGMYASIMVRSLAAQEPQLLLDVSSKEMRPHVKAAQDWANKRLPQMYFGRTMRRAALDGLFLGGIIKVSLSSPAESVLGGYDAPAGTPEACVIDFDDWVIDHHAKDRKYASYMGHRTRVPLDAVRESELYSKARKQLKPEYASPYNETGDERVVVLGAGDDFGEEEWEDYVELWEIYLPRQKLVVTFAEGVREPLRVVEWLGPDCGPYHFLDFLDVPGSVVPKAPIMDLIDLHDITNRAYTKLGDQTDRMKKILAVAGGGQEDADRVNTSKDGQATYVENNANLQEVIYGGPDNNLAGIAVHWKGLYSWAAGNLDALGGLAAGSDTVGQDRMLESSSSKMISYMQTTMTAHVSDVCKSLVWYWWNDPVTTMRSVWQMPGSPEIQVPRTVTPQERRMVPFDELRLRVNPYSISHDTPQSRLAALNQAVTQVILPALPLLQQQGHSFDVAAYLRQYAEYANMPELEEIVSISTSPMMLGEGAPDAGGSGPGQTTRRYERYDRGKQVESIPGEQALMKSMASMDQPSEMGMTS